MSIFNIVAGLAIGSVVDNKDPAQLGRVQVSFEGYGEGSGSTSWANLVQPMAGTKYGVYFIPEVGDSVLVGFLNNSHDHPVILGSLYIGSSGQADCYDADNYIKDIKTKGGNLVRFYDKAGEEEIKITNTENGNEIILNMKEKQITISSPQKIQLDAPDIFLKASNIHLKGGDVKIETTKDIYTDKTGQSWGGTGSFKLKVENNVHADVQNDANMLVQNNIDFAANGKLSLSGNNNVKIQSMIGDLTIQAATTADIKANAQMTVESSGQTAVKGTVVMIN